MSLLERLNRKKKQAPPLAKIKTAVKPTATAVPKPAQAFAPAPIVDAREDSYQKTKEKIHNRIIDEMPEDWQKFLSATKSQTDSQEVRQMIEDLCTKALEDDPFAVPLGDRGRLIDDLLAEIMGLGPIEPLLKDSTITEVMINGPKKIYIERRGKLELTSVRFRDDDHLMHVIDRIVSAVGRRVDEASPLVDARLLDGSRVNVIIPPLSLVGPCVTIRKFAKDVLTVEKLIEFGSLDQTMADFLAACVVGKLNIVVSGGTGSGKTTLLNVLSQFIPENERIVTLEDSAELQLRQEHLVTLETRPANIEGTGQVTMRDLVKNALRMRPDRIVVGEVRSGEALDMLQAMNTGHDGSMTTAHANNARDMLSRIETMVLMSGMELPLKAIRTQISSAIDLIVQTSRLRDGSRKITTISEVLGMEGEIITMQDLFVYEQHGLDENNRIVGRHVATGIRPHCAEKLLINGVELPDMETDDYDVD